MSRGKLSTTQSRPAPRQPRQARKPWFRSTVFVCLVSLVGSLAILGVFDRLSQLATPLQSVDEYGFDDLSSGHGGGDGGVGGAAVDRALFEAADMFSLGNEEYAAGNVEGAKLRFEEAVRFNPQHSFAWANLGNVQRDLRNPQEAVKSHRQAVALLPTRARHWYNLGVSLYSSGRPSLGDAIEAFHTALALNEGMAAAHFNLGVALAESGDQRAQARKAYERASELEPNSPIGHGARCNLCNLLLSLSLTESSSSGPNSASVSSSGGSSSGSGSGSGSGGGSSEGGGGGGGLWTGAQCLRNLLEDAPHYERAHVNLAGTLHTLADAGPAVLLGEAARVAAAAAAAGEAAGRENQQQPRRQVQVGTVDGAVGEGDGGQAGEAGEGAATKAAAATAMAGTNQLTPRALLREARRHYRRALELNPHNALAAHALSALEAHHAEAHFRTKKTESGAAAAATTTSRVPSEASAEYVGALFDSYAVEFDSSLHALGYQVPDLLRSAVSSVLHEQRMRCQRQSQGGGCGLVRGLAVDLGCGTGLCGPWMKVFTRRLVGVDLSSRMLEIAASRLALTPHERATWLASSLSAEAGKTDRATEKRQPNEDEEEEERTAEQSALAYDEVVHEDIGAALLKMGAASVDLVVAADVLCYLGDLRRVFVAARIAIQANGLFAFTVEALQEEGSEANASEVKASEAAPLQEEGAATAASGTGSRENGGVGELQQQQSDAAAVKAGARPSAAAVPNGELSAEMIAGGWRIDSSGRYRHRKRYLLALAEANGFESVRYEKVVARRRHTAVEAEAVEAHLFVLKKTGLVDGVLNAGPQS